MIYGESFPLHAAVIVIHEVSVSVTAVELLLQFNDIQWDLTFTKTGTQETEKMVHKRLREELGTETV